MRRVIAIAAAGFSLAGCSSFSMDYFKSAPPTVQLQLESRPSGADARTSLGPGCKTPCSVTISLPETGDFTVNYTLARFQPTTLPVTVTRTSGDLFTSATAKVEPNPVAAELAPIGPPPKAARKMMRPKKPKKQPKDTAAAPAASPFPEPAQTPPPTR
jgi:hypothetical protein